MHGDLGENSIHKISLFLRNGLYSRLHKTLHAKHWSRLKPLHTRSGSIGTPGTSGGRKAHAKVTTSPTCATTRARIGTWRTAAGNAGASGRFVLVREPAIGLADKPSVRRRRLMSADCADPCIV